ncbi:HAD hydrolase-like protein [Parahaliea mediterranea]|uniref:HAD hydrolase-like protein n=1 Tax=Parahaliea mediterranea TaxID=651086 RepID=A0A939IHI7_9GAMM|nr:HAD hydrolase-like protein [Parahaliea mediterranea]MBN7795509.1 HAD hydrolase-like protein [Parahaliea mediterranea]
MGAYFFDLDGTLTDSAPGLLNSFGVALDFLGVRNVSEPSLRGHLGEPLPEVFRSYLPDISNVDIESGIAAFRRSYDDEGIYVNKLYPGIEALLKRLRELDFGAWVVTSKPVHHAEKVCELLEIRDYFQGIIGAGLDEADTKSTLVHKALGLSEADPRSTIFLGDRCYDVVGALSNNVRPVGALWGYGSRTELETAGCVEFAQSPSAFLADYVESRVHGGFSAAALLAHS